MIVYFSGATENTARFVGKLGLPSVRIPIRGETPRLTVPYTLITPSYARGVPPQVVRFLNDETNRVLMTGVIGTGNMTFGDRYGIGARRISAKCQVPLLHLLELQGTDDDVREVTSEISRGTLLGEGRQEW